MKLHKLGLAAAAVALAPMAMAQEQGRDGNVSIIYWQAPSILNPYLSGGTKDIESASMILEPLANYDENGKMVPVLAADIPKPADDLKSITWKLKSGVVWSDGSPFTADDVVFTFERAPNVPNSPSSYATYLKGKTATKVDDHTAESPVLGRGGVDATPSRLLGLVHC